MKKSYKTYPKWLIAISICTQIPTFAQGPIPPQPVPIPPIMAGTPLWTLQGQVRTRSEIRHGLGNPVGASQIPAFFTSQRTALNAGFRWDKLGFGLQLRDVRVWGQDASSITNADGNKFFVHQAWGEFTLGTKLDTNARLQLLDNITLKVGRQEIVYDDVRLLGNLDWLQQGRRHDAAILKVTHQGHQFDAGFAFNQNSDAFGVTGTSYTPGNTSGTATSSNGSIVAIPGNFLPTNAQGAPITNNPPSTNAQNQQYKMFQYLYWSRKWNQTKFSILAFKDDFGKYTADTVFINRNSTDPNKPASFV
ncbi:MAG: alginate export family protein, partial [Bacteroidota bacterium]|nr:alginate export family protein [Bacteroidota bacterium]